MPQTERSQLSKTRVVMETIHAKIGILYNEIVSRGHVEAKRLFNEAYLEIHGNVRYHGSIKCTNAYKHIWIMNRKEKENAQKSVIS